MDLKSLLDGIKVDGDGDEDPLEEDQRGNLNGKGRLGDDDKVKIGFGARRNGASGGVLVRPPY